MLQSLLADRFKLVLHKDTKPMPSYILTVGGTPKLKAGTAPTRRRQAGAVQVAEDAPRPQLASRSPCCRATASRWRPSRSSSGLRRRLRHDARRRQTGLRGTGTST